MTLERVCRVLAITMFVSVLGLPVVFGQSDVERKTIAITYPLDETVTVKFRGTTVLPRLKGEAKVRRAGRRPPRSAGRPRAAPGTATPLTAPPFDVPSTRPNPFTNR